VKCVLLLMAILSQAWSGQVFAQDADASIDVDSENIEPSSDLIDEEPPPSADNEETSTTDELPAEEVEAAAPTTVPEKEVETVEEVKETEEAEEVIPPVQNPDTSADTEDVKIFGSSRLHLGVVFPDFGVGKGYKLVYGEPAAAPALGVDYFFFDWFATLGISLRLNYFKDTGKALIIRDDVITKDEAGKLELTITALQALAIFEATPFTKKWVVLSGWFGYEKAYFQEVRVDDATGTDDDDTNKLTNNGWREALVLGGGLSFCLDWLDSKSVNSMAIMGIKSVYLTPYFEIVEELSNKRFNFSRSSIGAAFTFESF